MSLPPDDDARGELAALVTGLRAHLGRHARAGAWAAPGGASPAFAAAVDDGAVDDGAVDDGAAAVQPAAMAAAAAPAVAPQAAPMVPVSSPMSPLSPLSGLDDAVAPRKRLSLVEIRADLGECTRCKLHTTRTKIVFGVGAADAPLMFVGEAPGADEDRTGEPFVGKAGQLLDKMIEAMGWSRRDVYIANVLKCRPPGNRNPEPDEIGQCQPFLMAQIASIGPRVIVALGRPASNTLLGNNAPISALRGRFHDFRGIKLMPTFHPAFLLRTPDRKRDAWSDLKLVMAELERLGIAPARG